MVLRVTNSDEEYGISTYKLSFEKFADKTYHPMIATTSWDMVYIDITDETPRGIIMQLVKRARVIPVFNKEEVTPKMLQILCEVIPDESAKLRSTYMRDKWEFKKLLEEIEQEYWRV